MPECGILVFAALDGSDCGSQPRETAPNRFLTEPRGAPLGATRADLPCPFDVHQMRAMARAVGV